MKRIRKRLAVVISIALTAGSFAVITAPSAFAMTGAGQQAASFVLGTLNDADGAPNIPTAAQLAAAATFAGPGASGFISARAGVGGTSTAFTAGGTTYGTSHVGGVTRTATVQVGAKMSFIATSVASTGTTSAGVSVVVTGGTLTSLVTTSSPVNVNTATTGASVVRTPVTGSVSLAGLFTVTAAAGETATLIAYTGTDVTDSNTVGATVITTWTFAVPRASLVLGNLSDQDGTPDQPTAANLASTVSFDPLPTAVGWVANTSLANESSSAYAIGSTTYGTSTTSSLARTGVVQSGAKISLIASTGATSGAISVVVTGGTLNTLITPTGVTPNLAGDGRSASIFSAGNSITPANPLTGYHPLSAVFSVTAAAGSTATIAAYSGTGIINGDTRTSGTLIAIWTLTVAAANAAGTLSLADSTVTQQACTLMSAGQSAVLAYDTTSTCANGRVGVVYVALKDGFTSAVTGGQLAATATGGSFVNVVNAASTTTGDNYSATTAFDTGAATAANYVIVTQPVANTGGSTTVTITYSGVVVGTKTIKWAGDVASITIDVANSATVIGNGVNSNTSGTSYALNVVYVVKDAAGNNVSSLVPTLVDATGAMLGASLSTSSGGAAEGVTILQSSASLNVGYATINHPGGTATANYGAGSYRIQVLNGAGVAVKSNVVTVTVADTTTRTFTASMDKASYTPGDFATLTISAKDVYGNPMPTGKTLPGLVISMSTGLTVSGAECTSASTFKAGVKECKFAVGNTAGSYSWSVALTSSSQQVPVTGSVKVTDSAVSNAEVLKSIVALIASINKQIAALQKLIIQRR